MLCISQMSEEDTNTKAIQVLLKSRPMLEGELTEAMKEWRALVVAATTVEMVMNGKLEMSWKGGQLYFRLAAPPR